MAHCLYTKEAVQDITWGKSDTTQVGKALICNLCNKLHVGTQTLFCSRHTLTYCRLDQYLEPAVYKEYSSLLGHNTAAMHAHLHKYTNTTRLRSCGEHNCAIQFPFVESLHVEGYCRDYLTVKLSFVHLAWRAAR